MILPKLWTSLQIDFYGRCPYVKILTIINRTFHWLTHYVTWNTCNKIYTWHIHSELDRNMPLVITWCIWKIWVPASMHALCSRMLLLCCNPGNILWNKWLRFVVWVSNCFMYISGMKGLLSKSMWVFYKVLCTSCNCHQNKHADIEGTSFLSSVCHTFCVVLLQKVAYMF